jgi:hypothetical protein
LRVDVLGNDDARERAIGLCKAHYLARGDLERGQVRYGHDEREERAAGWTSEDTVSAGQCHATRIRARGLVIGMH